MNGALNNASMALELALGDTARKDGSIDQALRTGQAAIAQASRAAALLAHIVHRRGAPEDPEGAYVRDVRELLREYARATGATLPPELDAGEIDPGKGAAEAADLLVAGLARMLPRGG